MIKTESPPQSTNFQRYENIHKLCELQSRCFKCNGFITSWIALKYQKHHQARSTAMKFTRMIKNVILVTKISKLKKINNTQKTTPIENESQIKPTIKENANNPT